jgi:hypothetical protein
VLANWCINGLLVLHQQATQPVAAYSTFKAPVNRF